MNTGAPTISTRIAEGIFTQFYVEHAPKLHLIASYCDGTRCSLINGMNVTKACTLLSKLYVLKITLKCRAKFTERSHRYGSTTFGQQIFEEDAGQCAQGVVVGY